MTPPLSEIKRRHLNSAIVKLRIERGSEVQLWRHEAEALFDEFCRLANYATLLGESSPAEMAGIFTREECEAMVDRLVAEPTGEGDER
jgi:hypothetical protein